jgi:hypothetical protein
MKTWKVQLVGMLPERLQAAAWAGRAYRRKFGRWPNLFFPQSFNEKVQAEKVWSRDPRLPLLADKVRVKGYVVDKLGADWITPTLWSGTTLPPRRDRLWPMPFVLKMNNGCRRNIFIRSAADCDWADIERRCDVWQATIYGHELGEWYYGRIPPLLLVEPFIGPANVLPLDYKFWTFHGRVEFIHVVTGRDYHERQAFFDRNWNRVAGGQGFDMETDDVPPPVNLEAMIAAAETLAGDLGFVRVDLYEIDGQPRFGEMTFCPGAGLNQINPPEFDRQLLALWRRPSPASAGAMGRARMRATLVSD